MKNFLLFQIGWFACVLGAANGYAAEGAVVALLIIAWHVADAPRPAREAAVAGVAAAVGLVFENFLVEAGWVSVQDGVYWLVILWALFATTLNGALRALQGRPWLAALVGALGGPLAYYAGERMGALQLLQPAAMLAALALGWAIATPLLLSLARRLAVP
ncbi:MAG TPA: DUF2878 domain-containing protein [Burkholderiales bacterium]|nr:DUF2878 domain-containing protein [Burkholderiales bacterium]